MSRKITETKHTEDRNMDSGFISGYIETKPDDKESSQISEEISGEAKSSGKNKSTKMSRNINETTLLELTDNSVSDSGFISGPCFPEIMVSECVFDDFKDGKKVLSEVKCEKTESGVINVTQDLLDLKLTPSERTYYPADLGPQHNIKGLPSLEVLFGQDDDGDTQLHIAAVHGAEKAVSVLIKVCPNKECLNIPNDEGMTPLHLAALSGNPVVTRMLVLAGASIDVRDKQGETPIHKATVLKNTECIKALLSPVQEHPQRFSTVNQKNYNGQACVHLAASAGHIETLQTLVYYGADINSTENLAGWTALHIAAVRGDAALVAALRGRHDVQRVADYAGRSPRRLARRHPPLHAAWLPHADSDSDSEDDTDDPMHETEETLFDQVRESMGSRLVV